MISTIIEALASDSSTTSKRAILTANKDDDVLRQVWFMTLNPRYNFYLRLKKPDVLTMEEGSNELSTDVLNSIVDTLNGRRLTGHAARDWLNGVLLTLKKPEQLVLCGIINRDLECGTSTGLVNDTWKKLIPEFPVMLAQPFTEKTALVFKPGKKIIVQKKEDGGRVALCVEPTETDDVSVTGFSRSGNELLLHGVFDALRSFPNLVFDGEILFRGRPVINIADGSISYSSTADRATGNGMLNKCVRKTISVDEAEGLYIVLWDVIDLADWRNGFSKVPYEERLARLDAILKELGSDKFKLIDSKECYTVEEVMEYYSGQVSMGNEGAIAKVADMPWEAERSDFMLKLKEILQATLRCVGTMPHRKDPSLIGSLELETACGLLTVSTGSGLRDEDRNLKPEDFIGKLIEMEYNGLIKARGKDSKWSMFLPTKPRRLSNGIEFRTDVEDADTLEKLQKFKKVIKKNSRA